MNGLGLLFLTTSHSSIAVYRLVKPGEWRARDIVGNLPLFLHQLAYSSCTVSLLLITIERTVIGLKPKLYSEKRISQGAMIAVCLLSELFIALPAAMLVQDGPIINGYKLYTTTQTTQKISVAFHIIFEIVSVMMVIISFVQSSHRYNNSFSRSSLDTRHQIKEVISLTRALIPICFCSLLLRSICVGLSYFAYSDEKVLDLFFTLIRFCSTAGAIIEPSMMLSRHRLLQNRLRLLLGLPLVEVLHPEVLDSATAADVYFDAFKKNLH
ncbi:hypothetical protein PENTCL1PPCAC_14949, partial [Pristionchus entomophagus]